MTHGRVSASQTLIYPLLPPSSHSIFVFYKQHKKQEKLVIVDIYIYKERILEVLHLHIWEENSFDQELMENA